MDFRIFIEPQQGTTYDAVCALAQATESLGFNGFFTSDHYLRMGDTDGLPGPLDAWTTLAGLARETTELRLGTLVTPVTFRHPGSFAVQAAQVDHMSGGRIEIGLGAGWYDAEHAATAIAFPPLGERFTRLEETAEILTGLWSTPTGDLYSFKGEYYEIVDSPALPKPQQSPMPFIVGGSGTTRTPRLAARIANEFNGAFMPVDAWTSTVQNVRSACRTEGRDANDLVYSAAQVLCLGSNEAEVERRAAIIGREPAELRENGVAGLPGEAADKIRSFADAGCERMYLQFLDVQDLAHLDLVSEMVALVDTTG